MGGQSSSKKLPFKFETEVRCCNSAIPKFIRLKKKHHQKLVGGFKYIFDFHPYQEKRIQFYENIFQMGWHHYLEKHGKYPLVNQHSNRISSFFNRKIIFKGSMFDCCVSLPGCFCIHLLPPWVSVARSSGTFARPGWRSSRGESDEIDARSAGSSEESGEFGVAPHDSSRTWVSRWWFHWKMYFLLKMGDFPMSC